jgi:hypothetical protein
MFISGTSRGVGLAIAQTRCAGRGQRRLDHQDRRAESKVAGNGLHRGPRDRGTRRTGIRRRRGRTAHSYFGGTSEAIAARTVFLETPNTRTIALVGNLSARCSLPPDPAGRTSYVAEEITQCDLWFPPIHLPVGFGQVCRPALLPVLTMITGYSRWLSAMLIPTRSAADLFAGRWQLIQKLGAVPRVLVWDGEGAIGRGGAGRLSSQASVRPSGGPWAPRCWSANPAIPKRRS